MTIDYLSNLKAYAGEAPGLETLAREGLPQGWEKLPAGEHEAVPGDAFLRVDEDVDAQPHVADMLTLVTPTSGGIHLVLRKARNETGVDGETSCRLLPGAFALLGAGETFRVKDVIPGTRIAMVRFPPPETREAPTLLRHKGTVELHTARLLLRRYRAGDEDAMFANWCSDPRVTKSLMWDTHPDVNATRAVLSSWLATYQSARFYHWGIEMDGELLGDIAVMRHSDAHRDCEIGYCLSHKAWNQGVMAEALRAVMRFLFDDVGLHRITLRHDVLNPASGRVMQKAGLTLEGVMRQSIARKDGTMADVVLYAAINGEWENT